MKMDHEEEKNNITKMPHHVTQPPVISPSHFTSTSSPAQNGFVSWGFHKQLSGGKGGPQKTEDFGPPAIFRILFVFVFFSHGGGGNRAQVDIAVTITHVQLYLGLSSCLCP